MALDILSEMEAEQKRAASAPKGAFRPIFLNNDLKDGVKALIRPLWNLDAALLLPTHHFFNQADPKQSVNAICGRTFGSECLNCDAAQNNKKLTAGKSFFLPVWLYAEQKQGGDGKWAVVTYKDQDGAEHAVGGLRILELQAFGRIADVLQALKTYYQEEDDHSIMVCDFIIEVHGEGTSKKITTMPKAPKLMAPEVRSAIPTRDAVQEMILSVWPPAGSTVTTGSGKAAPAGNSAIPEF